ncbi:MAG TPA: hypothetical protein VFN87_05985 [Solirubrobacteraceae bacterium]|nr:hypothetical protein [Solirubrobacteraceae bacterium]
MAQVGERRVAGAEVVDGEADPQVRQLKEDRLGPSGIGQHRRLGDLQLQHLRSRPGAPEQLRHLRRELAVEQVARREVDRHRHHQALLEPGPDLIESLVDDIQGERADEARLLGDRNERVREDEPSLRVMPAQQRLDALHLARAELRLGLVVKDELAVGQPSTQLGHQRQPAHVVFVGRLVVERERGAVALAVVHGDVGALDKRLGADPVAGVHGDAHRGLDRERQRLHIHRPLQRGGDPLQHGHGVIAPAQTGQEQAELVPAEAGDGVGGADGVADAAADLDEQLIPGGMTERVVDLLETVEVHERHGQLGAAALGVADRLGDALAEQHPVGQPGERIVQRLVLVELGLADELLLGALALGDVLDHRHRGHGASSGAPLHHRAHQRPHRATGARRAPRLQLEGLAPPAHHLRQQLLDDLGVVTGEMLGEAQPLQLPSLHAQHLLKRGVGLDRHPQRVEAQDPNRRPLKQRAEASDRPRLGAARLHLGDPRHRRREHHRQHLKRLPVVLGEPVLVGLAQHVERADHLRAAKQRHADHGAMADRLQQSLVDPRVMSRVLDEHGLPALDGEPSHRSGEGAAPGRDTGADAGDHARVERVAVDEADHRAIGTEDRLRPLADELHNALQVIAGGRDGALGVEDQRQALIA